ncbi:RhtX/FptX family siderophore transporter [Fulvimarina endophytica]|uniref:RhtX/FptX family siderophore transporter n=1 Tax=Fulvimarina endophytica TaxID=2293836 RepID=A0A371X2S9_9HYPH|nr:RhtX/FptX family siderophore transporter [Fulvimarina endophytica]RFC63541.1 RhtX/FptX family siderophore transporter [Fulvimarina endophytica]
MAAAVDGAARAVPAGRLYAVLGGLYLAQGVPTYLLLVALPPLMREGGASRTAIGLFSLLMIPLILKFAWAPLVDRFSPLAALGHRRGWVVPTQILVSAGIAAMAFVQPTDVGAIFAIATAITLLSSTQDIATDGYAARMLTAATRPLGNAIQAGAVALGVILGGTLALVLFGYLGWRTTLLTVAALSLLPLLVTPWMQDDETDAPPERRRPSLLVFFRRPDALVLLGFALTYRASEGLVRGMEGAYLVDAGLPVAWIGYLSGAAAATSGLVGALTAALAIRRFGLTPTLIGLGALRTLCFLAFSLNAVSLWPGMEVAMAASAFQTFLRYMELVALYSLFMGLASRDQPGTDFTLLTCAELVVYMAGSALAGFVADRFGYANLFAAATVLSGLGIAVAWMLLMKLHRPNA